MRKKADSKQVKANKVLRVSAVAASAESAIRAAAGYVACQDAGLYIMFSAQSKSKFIHHNSPRPLISI